MAKYMLTATTWVPLRPGNPCQHLPAGTVIEFDGIPGSSMAPLDAEGAKRMPRGRPHMEKMAKRNRAALDRTSKARLAAAEVEMRRA
jgi:hypothetical protein